MNKTLKKLLIFGLSLCLILCGAACTGNTENNKTVYTVTVTCEESEVLSNVKVQIKKADGSSAGESGLTNGKATFELETASYTATLTGVPEDYTFTEGNLSGTSTACTIAITKKAAQPADKTYSGKVTVQLPDGTAVKNIKVWLTDEKGNASSATTDENGVASFTLKNGVYSVRIEADVWPNGFTFDDEKFTLTVKDADAQVTVKFDETLNEYTVTVLYPDLKDVYDTLVQAAGPAQGVTVSLYEGKLEDDNEAALADKTPVSVKETDAEGKASFSLAGDLYTIVLSGYTEGLRLSYPEGEYVITISKEAPSCEVTFREPTRVGASSNSPLSFQMGVNTVPLTNQALSYNGMGIYYAFKPENTGNYTFSATNNALILKESFEPFVTGGKSAVMEMTAGETYLFICSATGTPQTYTVTIAEGGDIEGGGSEQTYPWTEGKGTVEEPYLANTLAGEYNNLHVPASSPFYLSYTPTADEEYTFSAIGDNLWLEIYDNTEDLVSGNDSLLQLNDDTTTGSITLKANTKYYILIGTWDDSEDTVGVKIEKKGGTAATPDGSKENPFVFETLPGEHSVTIVAGEKNDEDLTEDVLSVWYKYVATEDATYTLSDPTKTAWISVCENSTDKNSQAAIGQFLGDNMPDPASIEFHVKSGATYFFWICTWSEKPGTVTFKIEKKEGSETGYPWEGKGTLDEPYLLKSFEGNYSFLIKENALVYLSYTPAEKETYILSSSDENAYISVFKKVTPKDEYDTGREDIFAGDSKDMPKELSLEAGATYFIEVDVYEYDKTTTFMIEKKVEEGELYDCAITLLNTDGTTVANVIIKLINEDNKEVTATTDEHGVAHFRVAKGKYKVQVSKFYLSDSGFEENGPQDVVIPPDKYEVTVGEEGASLTIQYEAPAETPDEN